jgi:radical SAM protein with 4Fe4S-binding SPASM domain
VIARPETLSFTFELSRACNLRCQFCYNPWKIEKDWAAGEMSTADALKLVDKVIGETSPNEIMLSGGEPLLRKDIFEIIRAVKRRGVKVGLVTNGTLVTPEVADKCVSEGVDVFQVSLLSDQRELHNSLAGSESFDQTIEGILNLQRKQATVYTFFVGTSRNISSFRGALELNVLLGVRNVALGRFVPGGAAAEGWRDLLPSPQMLQAALDAADQLARRYPIAISISTPILPCLVDLAKYETITPGFCTVGDETNALFAIDPVGNLKVCSHSPVSLGNLFEARFSDIVKHRFLRDFLETVPEFCQDCPMLSVCKAGCRSSAHLCYGSFEDEDPFLRTWKTGASKTRPELAKLKDMAPEAGTRGASTSGRRAAAKTRQGKK